MKSSNYMNLSYQSRGQTRLHILKRIAKGIGLSFLVSAILLLGGSKVSAQTYCMPNFSDGCGQYDDYVANFALTGDNSTSINDQGMSCGTNDYVDHTALTPIALTPGNSYTAGITAGDEGDYAAVWIDFNDNGTFETNEQVGTVEDINSNSTPSTFSISIPTSAQAGQHRMRVMLNYGEIPEDACGDGGSNWATWGEAVDYTVNIVALPPCTGVPTAGVIDTTSSFGVCSSAAFTLNASGYTVGGGGITYQWQSRSSGTTTWQNIAGATSMNLIVANGITTATDYRVKVLCATSGDSSFTNTVTATLNPVTQCYCTPTYGSYNSDYLSVVHLTGNGLLGINYTSSSTPANGYANLTNDTLEQAQGLDVTFNTSYVGGNNTLKIWVDYNADGVFNDSTERVYANYVSGANQNGTFTIPSSVPVGTYRIRVSGDYGNDTAFLPCDPDQFFGTTLDFTLKVTPAPSCLPPTNLTATNINNAAATLGWTANNTGSTFDLQWGVSGFSLGNGTLVNNAPNPYNLTGLTSNTTYDYYVRQDCGTTNGSSLWVGPFTFSTTQTPAVLPYADSFNTNQFTFINNGQTNQWAYGSATGNTGNSIYISNNGGSTNTYTNSATSVAQAYRDIAIPAGATLGTLSFNWKANGESSFDYLRVWLVPVTFTPTAGTQITTGAGRIQLTGPSSGRFNLQSSWQTYSNTTLDLSSFAGQTMRLVYEWRNDGSAGSQPPAAVDNINLLIPTCTPPTGLTAQNITTNAASLTWTASGSTFDVEWGPSGFTQGTGTMVNNTANPYNLTGLTPNTNYDYYVRQECGGSNGNSIWVGPYSFITGQIPATLPYTDSLNTNQFTFINNGQTNQWAYGSATGNTGNSIYISKDSGNTNTYNTNSASVSQAYRDIAIPTGATLANLSFDWMGYGESSFDYLRVWLVPVSFAPTAGTQITTDTSRIQLIGPSNGRFNLQTSWQTYNNPTLDLSQFAGQTMRLVYEWRNDGSLGTQPPAAVDNINLSLIQPCSGSVVAGTISQGDSMNVCAADSFILSVTGATSLTTGLTYQWQSRAQGGSWTDVSGANQTTLDVVAGITTPTEYRFYIVCANGNTSDTTSAISLQLNPPAQCYCTPIYSNGCAEDDEIDNFLLNGENGTAINDQSTGCVGNTNSYDDRTSESVDLNQGATYSTEISSQTPDDNAGVWIDFNDDGVFDTSEMVGSVDTISYLGSNSIFNLSIPANATLGSHRMRVRLVWDDTPEPCGLFSYGETHDYTVNIVAPCTPPVVNLGNDTAICEGNALTIDAGNPGDSYLWSDGSTNQTLTVDSAGTYSVTVTDGSCSTNDTINITVNPLPVATGISIDTTADCSYTFSVNNAQNTDSYSWDFGDGSPADTNATANHAYTTNGSYLVTVILTNDCGTDTMTTTVSCAGLGIGNVNIAQNDFKLYPNPTRDFIVVQNNGSAQMQEVSVINVLGQTILKQTTQSSIKTQINVAALASGMYSVRIKTNEGIVNLKFEIAK